MDRLSRLIVCLKELGVAPKASSFESRLIIQKATLLLQLMGVELGYPFSLYIRGPYSPELTRDLYAYPDRVEGLRGVGHLTSEERKKIAKLVEISDRLNPIMLEIMATYAYLWKCMGKPPREAHSILKRLKPFYSDAQIAVGISKAKELLFNPSERELRELRKELGPWESLSSPIE